MNERIASALADRLQPLIESRLLSVSVGLVEIRQTDVFNGEKDKAMRKFPFPSQPNPVDLKNWNLLVPDPKKRGISYFEDGGFEVTSAHGMQLVNSRLTLVYWYNLPNRDDLSRDQLSLILLDLLMPDGRSVINAGAGLSIKIRSAMAVTSDPFAKYTAYNSLFNFRNQPYGWLAYTLSLKAYVLPDCDS